MIATVLSDNRSADAARFRTEHGLSVHLQTDSCQLLLDTGASDVFIYNAVQLGIDLSRVDYVFLSHGHADHTGGLRAFLEINSKAKVIVSEEALSGRFFSNRGSLHSISCEWPSSQMSERTIVIGNQAEISDNQLGIPNNIRVIADIPQNYPLPEGNRHLLASSGGELEPDTFRHEMALYTDGFLFTGCAHNGLQNILSACPWPLHTVLGGFHLLDSVPDARYETEAELHDLAENLALNYPSTNFYTGHCTGDRALRTMQKVPGLHLQQFSAGERIVI